MHVCGARQRAADRSGGNQFGPDLITWRRRASLPRRARAAATKRPGWRAPLFNVVASRAVAELGPRGLGFRAQARAERPQGGAPR
jgi:hypothetical protein